MAEKIKTYADFWPFYLREHSKRQTRHLHYVGTALAIGLLLVGAFLQEWMLFAGAVIAGYAFAWIAHLFIEKNRPATFTYPVWSLFSDFRMFFFWASGRLEGELHRAGVQEN